MGFTLLKVIKCKSHIRAWSKDVNYCNTKHLKKSIGLNVNMQGGGVVNLLATRKFY